MRTDDNRPCAFYFPKNKIKFAANIKYIINFIDIIRTHVYNLLRRLFLLNFLFIFNNRLAKVNQKITARCVYGNRIKNQNA